MRIRKEPYGFMIFTNNGYIVELGDEEAYAKTQHLSAPEIVHLCITRRCNRNCEFCYVEKDDYEPEKTLLQDLIDQLAEVGVFQIAVGGGEPFLRGDIFEVAEYASERKILFNVTTNGSLIDKELAKKINEKIDHTQITLTEYDKAALDAAQKLSRFGFNLLVTPGIASRFNEVVFTLDSYKPKNILLLEPKPSRWEWYERNRLERKEKIRVLKLSRELQGSVKAKILVDSCFSFNLEDNRVKGCMAGRRFCYIDYPFVHPCSFLTSAKWKIGDLREERFEDIWNNGDFRDFRCVGLNVSLNECRFIDQVCSSRKVIQKE